ncbi:MAG: hypothetical protein HZB41_05010 [Ignavibacteriae bacterium]|nr:hypothetical protein [Ignavibacteriota bacterium]
MNYIKILSIIVFIALFSLSFRSGKSIIDHPIIEDAYYTFSVAKNLANGNNISADGESLTNGFQPLFTFMIVPAFAITNNDYLSIRIIFILLMLLFAISAYLFAVIIRDSFYEVLKIGRQELFWISFLVYISATLFFKNQLNGLETGLLLLLILIFIRYYQKIEIFNFKNIIVLGIILGLLVITRIDTVLLVLIFFIYLLSYKEIVFKKRLSFALISGLITFVISSPWWYFNYHYFNSIMPTSGQAQFGFELNMARIYNIISAVVQNLVPNSYSFDRFTFGGWGGIIIRTLLSAFLLLFIKLKLPGFIKKLNENGVQNKRIIEALKLLIIYSIILTLYYFFLSSASHFYQRYLCPLSIIGLILTAIFISYLFINNKKTFITITTLITLGTITISATIFSGKLMNKSQFYKHQLTLVNDMVPKSDYVAAGQSGTLGFFRKKVINLDGKVNTDILKFNNKVPEYLSIKKVEWLCDWKFYAESYLGKNPEKTGWKIVGHYGDFFLYHKKSN